MSALKLCGPHSTSHRDSFTKRRSLPRQYEDDVSSAFNFIDRNQDGTISKEELSDLLSRLGFAADEETIDSMWSRVDTNGDGRIDYNEFLAANESLEASTSTSSRPDAKPEDSKLSQNHRDNLRFVFHLFDKNRDGFICAEDLHRVFSMFPDESHAGVDDCKLMIHRVDANGDGRVDFNEFCEMMEGAYGCPGGY